MKLFDTTSRLINEKIEVVVRYLKHSYFSKEWIQSFLRHTYYKTTMDMYGTVSIDEMQQESETRWQEWTLK